MKKILDNGHIMHYNNHCSAGVAHLVERDLAKVEVASSSLVARSKISPSDRAVFFFLHLSAGQRLEQGTSEARETCRGHVLVPACVWRPGWAASEPRRPLQKETPSQQDGVSLHLPGRWRCAHRHAGSTKASYFYDAFVLLGRWSKGTLFHYLLYFFLLTTVVPMAAPPLTSSRAIHKAEPLVSPVWGDLGSSFSFAVTVSAFLTSLVPSLSL